MSTGNRCIAELSVDSRLLYEHLRKAAVGDTISYEDLSAVIGRDVQREARGMLCTARRMALRDDHMVFLAVTNVGLKFNGDVGAIDAGEMQRRRSRRAAEAGIRILTQGVRDFEALPNQQKVRHNTELALQGTWLHMNRSPQVKCVATAVTNSSVPLAIAKTLDLFREPK